MSELTSKEIVPSAKDLIDSLARFADHNELCPRGQWKPEDEEDFDMPECTCGLELLLNHASVFVQQWQPASAHEPEALRPGLEHAIEILSKADCYTAHGARDSGLINADISTEHVQAFRDHMIDNLDAAIRSPSPPPPAALVCGNCSGTGWYSEGVPCDECAAGDRQLRQAFPGLEAVCIGMDAGKYAVVLRFGSINQAQAVRDEIVVTVMRSVPTKRSDAP